MFGPYMLYTKSVQYNNTVRPAKYVAWAERLIWRMGLFTRAFSTSDFWPVARHLGT